MGKKGYYLSIIDYGNCLTEAYFSLASKDEDIQFDRPLMSLCNALLRSFHRILPEDVPIDRAPSSQGIFGCYKQFYQIAVSQDIKELIDVPVLPFTADGLQSLWLEVWFLRQIIRSWLNPRDIANSDITFDPITKSKISFALNFHEYRHKQTTSDPIILGSHPAIRYTAPSLLPLCWEEVWYALEYKIAVGSCLECSEIYLYKPKHPNQAICGSEKCKYQRDKRKNGESVSAQNKKNRKQGRRPGRPEHTKAEEARKLHGHGYRPDEIAGHLRVDIRQVKRWVNKAR